METNKTVIIFSTPTCPACQNAKRYFKENNIRFKDIDVSKDELALKDMIRRTNGNNAVPVILINNRPIIGFNKSEINRLLNIKTNSN
ncbi:MAG TPA: glutaredoxin domain-containing protein [Candidatus Kapabacteria bacterium]|jgi:glutaredoxin-like YruB-family protein|nr:glutaredoxin family protein [Candidatus Kapabacteria bacterium]HOV92382.1 glutaredoxin domain-containing protein [Candidatus Kapabacteria bacterium]